MSRTRYGASTAGAILGLSPFRTPYEVWSRATGRDTTPSEATEATRWGNVMEPAVLRLTEDRIGWAIEPGPVYTAPPVLAPEAVSRYASCHPDGIIRDAPGGPLREGVEAKAPYGYGEEWPQEGACADVPPTYLVQVLVSLAVTGADRWHLSALLGRGVRLYTYERADWLELALEIIGRCDQWWERHVVADVAPELDGSRAASADYARMMRAAPRPGREATADEAALIRQYADLGAEIKRLEAERESARLALLRAAEGSPRLTVGAGKGAWGLSVSAVAGRETVDVARLRAEHPDIYAAVVRTGEPYTTIRTFGVK